MVWVGTASACPSPLPIPGGCVLAVDPIAFLPHLFPLRGTHVVAVMPNCPVDNHVIGMPFQIQSFIVASVPVGPPVLLVTNPVAVTVTRP